MPTCLTSILGIQNPSFTGEATVNPIYDTSEPNENTNAQDTFAPSSLTTQNPLYGVVDEDYPKANRVIQTNDQGMNIFIKSTPSKLQRR